MSGRKSFKNLSDKLRSTPEGREAVEREEHIVRDLLRLDGMREARGVDRAELDRAWAESRTEVSHVEQEYEGDYLSTLRRYVAALGGHLEISAVFPDQTITLGVPQAEREHPGQQIA